MAKFCVSADVFFFRQQYTKGEISFVFYFSGAVTLEQQFTGTVFYVVDEFTAKRFPSRVVKARFVYTISGVAGKCKIFYYYGLALKSPCPSVPLHFLCFFFISCPIHITAVIE